MLRVVKHGDVRADRDEPSLDFGRAFVNPLGSEYDKQETGPLWRPGVKVHKDLSPIILQQLNVLSDNVHAAATTAAEELDKFYASIPEEAFDLTFQDLVERNNFQKQRTLSRDHDEAKNVPSANGTSGEVPKKNGKVKQASKVDKNNGRPYILHSHNIATRLTDILSPKREFSPPKREILSAEDLEKLVDKRRKQSPKREGLYSASVTPIGSCRLSPLLSPKLSARRSFTDYMLPIDRHSFRAELERSVKFLELDSVDSNPLGDGSQGQSLSKDVPRAALLELDQTKICSKCSASNVILKTHCQTCGNAYCRPCVNLAMSRTPEGLKCKKTCVTRPRPGNKLSSKTQKGCLLFSMCCQVEVSETV